MGWLDPEAVAWIAALLWLGVLTWQAQRLAWQLRELDHYADKLAEDASTDRLVMARNLSGVLKRIQKAEASGKGY